MQSSYLGLIRTQGLKWIPAWAGIACWFKLCSNGSRRGWIGLWPAGLNWHFGAETEIFDFQRSFIQNYSTTLSQLWQNAFGFRWPGWKLIATWTNWANFFKLNSCTVRNWPKYWQLSCTSQLPSYFFALLTVILASVCVGCVFVCIQSDMLPYCTSHNKLI